MRNKFVGGGALAAGILLVLGLVFVSGQGSAPSAHAQTPGCPDNQDPVRCLTIIKAADNTTSDFNFTFDGGAFTLGAGEQASFVMDNAGTHVVVEGDIAGWELSSISCSSSEGVNITQSLATGTLTVAVTAADDEDASATCAFTNTADATATPTQTATATTTATAAVTATAEATATTESTTTTADATATVDNSTPVVPTVVPFPPTPRPPASEVQSGTIVPPATGSGGLK
jgi:hypothetical protein